MSKIKSRLREIAVNVTVAKVMFASGDLSAEGFIQAVNICIGELLKLLKELE